MEVIEVRVRMRTLQPCLDHVQWVYGERARCSSAQSGEGFRPGTTRLFAARFAFPRLILGGHEVLCVVMHIVLQGCA